MGLLVEAWFRVCGRGPVPEASDRVVAERVRSTLGPLERRLGVTPVLVEVSDGVATLTGDSPGDEAAALIVGAVAGTTGVRKVRSELRPQRPPPSVGTSEVDGAG